MAMFRVRNALAAGMAAILTLTLSTAAHAATITVDSLADTGAPGICVLRDAITAANTKTATNGCIAGTGNDTIEFGVTGTISLASTLPQVTDINLTIRGPSSPVITLDGGSRVRVMKVRSGASIKLNNLTIAHGLANSGGGIDNAGTLTVINSTFAGNTAINKGPGGGGIYNSGSLTISNSTFTGNNASPDGDGAGIENSGSLTVTNSTFTGNNAFLDNFGGFGGGIDTTGAATVTNSIFSDNSADFAGSGIFTTFGSLTVTNSTFVDNFGGGIANSGSLTVTNSTFVGDPLGGILNEGSSTIKSTILAANGGINCFSFGVIGDAGYNISDDSSCGFSATGSHNKTNPMLDPMGLRHNGGPTQTIALLDGSPAIDAIPLAHCIDQASPPNPIITDQRLFPRPDAGEANCDIGAYEFQDKPFVPFSRFGGGLTIHPNGSVYLSGRFELGPSGSIDPTTQPLAFSLGSYAVRLPAGSFVKYKTGYVYQKKVNDVFLCLYLKFTNTPGKYLLLAYRKGGTITETASLVPVTLTIGDNSGSSQMNVRFN